mgnify:CR=1 FL=1
MFVAIVVVVECLTVVAGAQVHEHGLDVVVVGLVVAANAQLQEPAVGVSLLTALPAKFHELC